jgi:hypothetical protein
MPVDMSGPETILGAYFKNRQLKQEQLREQHEYEMAQKTHENAQQQIKDTAKFHQDTLKQSLMLAQMQAQEHFNRLYGNGPGSAGAPPPTPEQEQSPSFQSPVAQSVEPYSIGSPGMAAAQSRDQSDPNSPAFHPSTQQNPASNYTYNMTPEQGYSGPLKELFPGGIPIQSNFNQQQAQAGISQQTALLKALGPILAQNAGSLKGAEAAGEYPYARALAGQKEGNARTMKIMELDAAKENNKLTNQSRITAANIAAMSRVVAAKSHNQVSADDIAAAVDQLDTGEAGLSQIPSAVRTHATTALHGIGHVAIPPKNIEAINGVQDLEGAFSIMDQMKDKLGDTALGALGTKLKGAVIGTDLKNLQAQITSMAPALVRSLNGLNRLNMPEINNQANAMANSSITKDQAEHNIATLRYQAYSQIMADKLGSAPWDQKVKILEKHDLLKTFIGKNVLINGKIVPIVRQSPSGETLLLDPQSKTYKVIHSQE